MDWHAPEPETVAPGVHRLPLPLPSDALRAINVYVVEGAGGTLILVDSGWHGPATASALERQLRQLGKSTEEIGEVLVTHLHGDHVGQAADLRRRTGAEVALGADESRGLELIRAGTPARLADRDGHLLRAGAGDVVDELRASTDDEEDLAWETPDRWLREGDHVTTGERTLRTLATPGHTRGHLCFVDEARQVLFAGDHVLPHITPSIGFEGEPSATSLADFLASLARVRELEVGLVLPAHGPPFTDLRHRVDELVAHHEERLDATGVAVRRGAATVRDVAEQLPWTRRRRRYDDLGTFDRMLAVWETFAHLELLVQREALERGEVAGIVRFSLPHVAVR
jgi:glyoxylase-like metal-dependent hydrolase (beta-lactamase superfamily II)